MPHVTSIRSSARRRRAAGYSLVELMVAAAVLASAAMGIYAVFLRMNEAAADLRFYTSAKQLLERAATQALTVSWTTELETTNLRPTILTSTANSANADKFEKCDVDYNSNVTGSTSNGGIYALFIDPSAALPNDMNGTLYRKVTEVPLGANGLPASSNSAIDDSKMLLQITFRLDYTVHGKTKPSMYFYTARARTKN